MGGQTLRARTQRQRPQAAPSCSQHKHPPDTGSTLSPWGTANRPVQKVLTLPSISPVQPHSLLPECYFMKKFKGRDIYQWPTLKVILKFCLNPRVVLKSSSLMSGRIPGESPQLDKELPASILAFIPNGGKCIAIREIPQTLSQGSALRKPPQPPTWATVPDFPLHHILVIMAPKRKWL